MAVNYLNHIKAINLPELIARIANRTGMKMRDYSETAKSDSVTSFTAAFVDEIVNGVVDGKKVVIKGFGTMYLAERNYVDGRIEGEVRFLPSELFKEKVRDSRIQWKSYSSTEEGVTIDDAHELLDIGGAVVTKINT